MSDMNIGSVKSERGDVQTIYSRLQNVLDQLQGIEARLAAKADQLFGAQPQPPETMEAAKLADHSGDVGALYSLVERLEMEVAQLSSIENRLIQL